MAKMNKVQLPDSLSGRFDTLNTRLQSNLIELLGKPLYNILESGEVKSSLPFGIQSKFDLYDKSMGIRKKFGKNYEFSFDFNKKNPYGIKDYKLKVTKDL